MANAKVAARGFVYKGRRYSVGQTVNIEDKKELASLDDHGYLITQEDLEECAKNGKEPPVPAPKKKVTKEQKVTATKEA